MCLVVYGDSSMHPTYMQICRSTVVYRVICIVICSKPPPKKDIENVNTWYHFYYKRKGKKETPLIHIQ